MHRESEELVALAAAIRTARFGHAAEFKPLEALKADDVALAEAMDLARTTLVNLRTRGFAVVRTGGTGR